MDEVEFYLEDFKESYEVLEIDTEKIKRECGGYD